LKPKRKGKKGKKKEEEQSEPSLIWTESERKREGKKRVNCPNWLVPGRRIYRKIKRDGRRKRGRKKNEGKGEDSLPCVVCSANRRRKGV